MRNALSVVRSRVCPFILCPHETICQGAQQIPSTKVELRNASGQTTLRIALTAAAQA
jgi:hypothetical protein